MKNHRPTRVLSRNDSLDTLIDRLDLPALAIDGAGRLLHANQPGAEALLPVRCLALRNGIVGPRDEKMARSFAGMLASALPDDPIDTAARRCSALPLVDAESRDTVLVAQALRGPPRPSGLSEAEAVLFLIPPSEKARLEAIRLRIVFGLTPAETRLALHLMRGMSLAAIGERLRVSRETLKTQLSSLFEKTGTSRQGELIALFLSSIPASATCA